MSFWQVIRRQSAVVMFYGLLAWLTLSPLSFHLGTQVPGGKSDYFHFNWNYWWIRHALQSGQNPYYTDMVLVPFRHNLALHSLTPIWFPVYVVLEPLVGQLRSTNLVLWISITLTGWMTYLFLRRQAISAPLALLGGMMLAFSPNMRGHILDGHLNLIGFFWMPVALLLWDRVVHSARSGWAVLTGLALWGAWLTDGMVLLWTALVLGPYALLTLVQAGNHKARMRLVLLGGLACGTVLGLAWFIAPLPPLLDADLGAFSPLDYQTARDFSLSPKVWSWQAETGEPRGFGILLVLLTVTALFFSAKDRPRWFWLLVAIPPLILALGPDVDIVGVRVPLPFRLVHSLSHGQYRVPSRFVPVSTLALIVYVGRTFTPWFQRLRRPALRGSLVAVTMLVYMADAGTLAPLPVQSPPPPYAFYTMMRQEHADYVVLEVPTSPSSGTMIIGWQSSLTSWHPEAMFYGITHEKRMVSGLLSRIPDVEGMYYEQSPLLGWLAGARALDVGPATAELTRLVAGQWGAGEVTAPIGYVVVHQSWLSPERTQEILALFNAHPSLCFVEVERDAVFYRTTSHPKGCPPRIPPEIAPGVYRIPLGQPGDEGFIGQGWFWQENIGGTPARWAGGRPEAVVYASLPSGRGYSLTLRAVAFYAPRTVKVVANAENLGSFVVSPGEWSEHTVRIPADLVDRADGNLVVSLSADGMLSPADAGLSGDTRLLAVAYNWVEFRAGLNNHSCNFVASVLNGSTASGVADHQTARSLTTRPTPPS
jgi:hypothetical protein